MQKRDLRAGDSMMQGNGVLPPSAESVAATTGPRRARRVTIVMGLLLAMTLPAGCSGDTNDTAGTGGSGGAGGAAASGAGGGGASDLDAAQDGLVTCARPNDPVDTYLPNMSKLGSNGALTFTLAHSDNAPPIRDKNVWKLKIVRADQSIVMGDIVPDVKMPYHTHPARDQPKINYDAAAGVYVADPLYFFMAGYWSSKFTAYQGPASDAEAVDSGTFYFCID
jgi:hypothetical protein